MTTVRDILEMCRGLPLDAPVVQRGWSVYWRLKAAGRQAPSALRDAVKCTKGAGRFGSEPMLVLEVEVPNGG